MKVTCREVAELLIDFVGGDLSELHMLTLHQHIGDCPPCHSYLETYKTSIQMMRALPAEPLPIELDNRLRKSLEEWRLGNSLVELSHEGNAIS